MIDTGSVDADKEGDDATGGINNVMIREATELPSWACPCTTGEMRRRT